MTGPAYFSHADLGGRLGMGPVLPEPEGEHFHADWEPRVLALTLAMGATGQWNIDTSRSARETLPDYAQRSYYQIWLAALERLMLQRGLVAAQELEQGHMLRPPLPLARVLAAERVPAALAAGSPTQRPATREARFAVGDAVRTHADLVDHHTRLPGYARGKQGIVALVHGVHIFADSHARSLGEAPQWLYGVVFEGAELWGEEAREAGLKVSVDAWESYLEPA